ncbi:MAG: hypothetical protein Kow00117_21220 [Phototrophicales bacterium]
MMIFRLMLAAVFLFIAGVCLLRKDIALDVLHRWRQISPSADWERGALIVAIISGGFGLMILLRSVWFAIAMYSFSFGLMALLTKDLLWRLVVQIACFFGERWYKPSAWDSKVHMLGRVLISICLLTIVLDTIF